VLVSAFFSKNMFAGNLMLDFSLKIKMYNVLAHVCLLIFNKFVGTYKFLLVCVLAEKW
jgi:hypothetical protein